MNRQLTALFAALEALLVIAIGIAIPLAPLTVLWGAQFGFAVDWAAFWRASVDIWLLGHGVDITFALDSATAATLGLPAAGTPFTVTIAILGFGLLTVLLAVRAGHRIADTRYATLGALVAIVVFAGSSLAVTLTALHPLARPSISQGTILPTVVFAVGLAIGLRRGRRETDARPHPITRWLDSRPTQVRLVIRTALTGGAAAAAAVVTVAAVLTSVAIALSYAKIISLYEGLHTEVLGGVAVTLGQIAFLPNLVVWSVSWLVGPGFALGTGSAVGPLGTSLGPIPAIPVLGALPAGDLAFGFVGLVVPIAAGFLAGAVLGPGLVRRLDGPVIALAGVCVGIVGGVILGLLAWFSGGAAGPGRLADVGPNPWAVGGWAAVQFAIACTIGLYASQRRSGNDRPR